MKNWKSEFVLVVFLGASVAALAAAQASTAAEAIALEQQGKLPEAAAAWKAVTVRNPTDAAAFASLGVVLAKQGQYSDATNAYRKALKVNRSYLVSSSTWDSPSSSKEPSFWRPQHFVPCCQPTVCLSPDTDGDELLRAQKFDLASQSLNPWLKLLQPMLSYAKCWRKLPVGSQVFLCPRGVPPHPRAKSGLRPGPCALRRGARWFRKDS
jgi:tetratricopeptide (TPR) repeat protein